MRKLLIVLTLGLSAGCATSSLLAVPVVVDIPAILANPQTYHGKLVQISGASVVKFEAQYICPRLAQIDGEHSHECLWLREGIGEGYGPNRMAELHKKRVVLVGRFDSSQTGHGGAYGGSIVPITVRVVGTHVKGDVPPPPPEPSANNSFKPKPLRGSA